jgi:hypothetical protein
MCRNCMQACATLFFLGVQPACMQQARMQQVQLAVRTPPCSSPCKDGAYPGCAAATMQLAPLTCGLLPDIKNLVGSRETLLLFFLLCFIVWLSLVCKA